MTELLIELSIQMEKCATVEECRALVDKFRHEASIEEAGADW